MTATQQLHNFLSLTSKNVDLEIPRLDLIRDFRSIYKLLLSSDWLIKDYQKRFLCDECGATHEVHNLDGKFFIGCDTDENSGANEINKDDLFSYSLSMSKLISWLSGQIGLPEKLEKIGNESWYLGLLKLAGKNRKVYFSLFQNPSKIPDSPNRVVLFVGKNQHQEHPQATNLLSLLSINGGCFKFDRKSLLTRLSKHITLDGLIIKINDQLVLNQKQIKGKKSTIHFGKLSQGKFEHIESIKPQAFNIINYLYKLPSINSKMSSAELEEQQGLARNRRTITARIKDVNDILTERNFPKLVLTDSDDKHYINPNLI